MKLQRYVTIHKRAAIGISSIVLIGGIALWLHLPLLRNAGNSNGYNCSRMHIYLPRRLDFKGCRTVTGTIEQIKIEPDGDSHALLKLDDNYKNMLTQQNYAKQQGYLVIEDTCHAAPSNVLVHLVCLNYASALPAPKLHGRYEITGNYVIDDWHGSWAEIHGLTELKLIYER